MHNKRQLNIYMFLAGTVLILFILENFYRSFFLRELALTRDAVPKFWQFITFAFYTGLDILRGGAKHFNVLWFIFHILIIFWFGRMLEEAMGSLKFLAFVVITLLGESVTVYLLGEISLIRLFGLPFYYGGIFHLSLMMMFGLTYPREEIYVFFILRVRVLYLAIIYYLYYLFLVYHIWARDFTEILMILAIMAGGASGIFVFKVFSSLFNRVKTESNRIIETQEKKKISSAGENQYQIFSQVRNKIAQNLPLSSPEKKFIESLQNLEIEGKLCSSDDFEPETDTCKTCENYRVCIKRFLDELK